MNTELCSFLKNKHDHKRVLCILLCVLVIFSLINISFADSNTVTIVPMYIATTGNEVFDNGIVVNEPWISSTYYRNAVSSSNNSTYIFGYPSSTGYYIYMVSQEEFTAYRADDQNQNSKWFSEFSSNAGLSGTELEGYYTYQFNAKSTTNTIFNVPLYSTLSEGIEAINEYIENNQAWSGPATVSVEAGCVAYILVDGGTANLTTTFPELSKLSRPLWVSGSTYSFEDTLPSSDKVFSSTTGTLIDWLIPASAKKDLLGRSYVGGRPLSDLPNAQYLVIYNPVYRGYDDKGVGIMSPTIYVSLSNYGAVRQYRLTASYNGGIIESTSEDGYTSWFDSIGEEELDANGNPVYIEHKTDGTTSAAINIPAGGGNIIIDTENADNSIGGLLQRLVNLLSAPIRYIEKLFNAGVGFFTMLASLWSWLPEEVSTIIASALVVLIVIGVVKFLWK